MACFVLIHGGMHGGWCWDPIQTRLRAAGHTVVAPDLPGMGDDPTPLEEVTLAVTAARVAEVVRSQTHPVVLVGHSMGGMAISEAAELVCDELAGLVYVSAVLRPAGYESSVDASATALPLTYDAQSFLMTAEAALDTLYNTSPREAALDAVKRLQRQPFLPQASTVTEERFGRVPRAFVECLHDRAIPLAEAREMQERLPCNPVFTLDCDHSPFLSAPDELTSCLIQAALAFSGSGSSSWNRQ